MAIVVAGAGIGLMLGPASTDAVNRAIGASYGEVTGISQTVRNYGSSLGLAVLGTILLNVNVSKVTNTLVKFGVPGDQARAAANQMSQQTQGSAGSGGGPGSNPQVLHAIQVDFAQSSRVVFNGMAIAFGIAFVFALFHPGGKVTREKTTADA